MNQDRLIRIGISFFALALYMLMAGAFAQDWLGDALRQANSAMQMANRATAAASQANQEAAKALSSRTAGDILQVNLAGDILFAYDSSQISPDGVRGLTELAAMIRDRSRGRVLIIGHTDNKGSEAYNQQLAQRRAEAVMYWLNRQAGISLHDMQVLAAGEGYPVAPNQHPDGTDNPRGRAMNRRVEVQIPLRAGVSLGMGAVQVGDLNFREPEIQNGPGNCNSLCAMTAGRHDMQTIACMEGTFEELGQDMDEGSCGQLENVMMLGFGNAGGKMCSACVSEARISDDQCRKVMATCFR